LTPLSDARRVVIKIGSSLLTNAGAGLDRAAIADWVRQIARLRSRGVEVVVVSSGAIAEGMKRLGWTRRPHAVNELQAAAAVGQMGLVQMWESCFSESGLRTAQVLLTHEDLGDRKRYLNARTTLRSLVALGVVPIINENDTVVVEEIRFGDNDTLGALVTNLMEADALVILTDQKGLHSADPRRSSEAPLVAHAKAGDPALEAMAGGTGSHLGSGGMLTKVLAAKRAARSGAHTAIAWGASPTCCCACSPANRSARSSPPRPLRWPRASNGSRTISSPREGSRSTRAPRRRSSRTARACSPSAPPRSRGPSSAARS